MSSAEQLFFLLRGENLWLFCLLSAVLGAIVGSFLGVVIERLPLMLNHQPGEPELSLALPRSHCSQCQHVLNWWENVPIASWLALRGRCSQCHSAIPARLLWIEVTTALLFCLMAILIPSPERLLSAWILIGFLLALSLIDWWHMLLPDALTQPLLWLGLLINAGSSAVKLSDAVYGAVAGYLCLWLLYWLFRGLTGKEGLGYGDFKLLAALGAWLGWQALPFLCLIAGLSGMFIGVWKIWRSGKQMPFPFGPCLSISGAILFIFYNSHIYL